jgi:hypothetical protein
MDGSQVESDASDVLTAAVDRLAVERRRIEDELDAFAAFERALRDIEPAAAEAAPLAVRGCGTRSRSADGLDPVRDAYERTVMGVPHYDEEYGDTLGTSLVEEFGPDVAAAVVDGSAFTDRHRSVLLSAAAEAQTGRETMRTLVDDERAAVEAAREAIREIERDLAEITDRGIADADFGTLEAARAALLGLESRCTDGVERRQETIARLRRRTVARVETEDYREFCYAALDVDHPVLSAWATVLGRIRERRRAAEREMAYASE